MGDGGTAPLILSSAGRWRWGEWTTPRPGHFIPGTTEKGAGWAPDPVWTRCEEKNPCPCREQNLGSSSS